jgi:hypothetical protein
MEICSSVFYSVELGNHNVPHVTVAIMTLSSEIEQHSTNSILDGQLEILITQLVPINF